MSDSLRSALEAASQSRAALVAATVVSTLAVFTVARAALYPRQKPSLPNPLRTTIPYLSDNELKELYYLPDAFPGARDVSTPYGSIRVYEWGPEDGERVLMIHGISTPCITLGPIARGLVARGYRLMLFDLFGRGFSDGVGDLPHDARLYTTQVLLVLASSPLPWTGTKAFHLIGYSLGGGVAQHFSASFPHMVSSLVLLAPSGLIRRENFGFLSRLVFTSGLVPDRILSTLTRLRLRKPIASSVVRRTPPVTPNSELESEPVPEIAVEDAEDHTHESYIDLMTSETAHETPTSNHVPTPTTPLEVRVLRHVSWMTRHHAGFIPAFTSSVRFAPLTDQHAVWAKLADRPAGTTCVILALNDEVVDLLHYRADGLPLIGGKDGGVRWRELPGGHDFVMTHSREILGEIDRFWGLE